MYCLIVLPFFFPSIWRMQKIWSVVDLLRAIILSKMNISYHFTLRYILISTSHLHVFHVVSSLHVSRLLCVLQPHPFLLPQSDGVNNIWRRLQMTELLVMQVSSDSCYLFSPLRCTNFLQHLVLKHPQFMNSFSWNNAVRSDESQKEYQRTHRLHLLGWRVSHARNRMKREASQAPLTLRSWRW
jgi:hypothetical protein